MSIRVPDPPQPKKRESVPVEAKSKMRLAAPLDAEFLGRTYITTLWMGTVFSICAWGITRSTIATGSFLWGALLGALLLKSQEIFVRRVIAPRSGIVVGSWDARIPIAVLLPLKYILIGLTFSFLISRGWLHPIAFTIGFLMEQVVIVSKVIGRSTANHMRQSPPLPQNAANQNTANEVAANEALNTDTPNKHL